MFLYYQWHRLHVRPLSCFFKKSAHLKDTTPRPDTSRESYHKIYGSFYRVFYNIHWRLSSRDRGPRPAADITKLSENTRRHSYVAMSQLYLWDPDWVSVNRDKNNQSCISTRSIPPVILQSVSTREWNIQSRARKTSLIPRSYSCLGRLSR